MGLESNCEYSDQIYPFILGASDDLEDTHVEIENYLVSPNNPTLYAAVRSNKIDYFKPTSNDPNYDPSNYPQGSYRGIIRLRHTDREPMYKRFFTTNGNINSKTTRCCATWGMRRRTNTAIGKPRKRQIRTAIAEWYIELRKLISRAEVKKL